MYSGGYLLIFRIFRKPIALHSRKIETVVLLAFHYTTFLDEMHYHDARTHPQEHSRVKILKLAS